MDIQERIPSGATPSTPDIKFTVPIHGPVEGNLAYELRAEDGTVLYVGSTKNLRERISTHKSAWIKWHRIHGRGEVSAHTHGPYKTRDDAYDKEQELLWELSPVRNLAQIVTRPRI
jgi:predicted GIY-YIG superfamily endonuclease